MIHAGIGPTHVNSLISTMNIPPMRPNCLKRREREIGPTLEKVAKRVCKDAYWEECKLTDQDNLTLSYDMGWQKRGKGFNSLTGVGHLIGSKTKKVVGYRTRNKRCATCHLASLRGRIPRKHDCRKKWFGSSKGMEPDVVVELVKECNDRGVTVRSIIGDDDSITLKRLREEIDTDITKISDIVHTKRTLTNRLYELKKNHKELTAKATCCAPMACRV